MPQACMNPAATNPNAHTVNPDTPMSLHQQVPPTRCPSVPPITVKLEDTQSLSDSEDESGEEDELEMAEGGTSIGQVHVSSQAPIALSLSQCTPSFNKNEPIQGELMYPPSPSTSTTSSRGRQSIRWATPLSHTREISPRPTAISRSNPITLPKMDSLRIAVDAESAHNSRSDVINVTPKLPILIAVQRNNTYTNTPPMEGKADVRRLNLRHVAERFRRARSNAPSIHPSDSSSSSSDWSNRSSPTTPPTSFSLPPQSSSPFTHTHDIPSLTLVTDEPLPLTIADDGESPMDTCTQDDHFLSPSAGSDSSGNSTVTPPTPSPLFTPPRALTPKPLPQTSEVLPAGPPNTPDPKIDIIFQQAVHAMQKPEGWEMASAQLDGPPVIVNRNQDRSFLVRFDVLVQPFPLPGEALAEQVVSTVQPTQLTANVDASLPTPPSSTETTFTTPKHLLIEDITSERPQKKPRTTIIPKPSSRPASSFPDPRANSNQAIRRNSAHKQSFTSRPPPVWANKATTSKAGTKRPRSPDPDSELPRKKVAPSKANAKKAVPQASKEKINPPSLGTQPRRAGSSTAQTKKKASRSVPPPPTFIPASAARVPLPPAFIAAHKTGSHAAEPAQKPYSGAKNMVREWAAVLDLDKLKLGVQALNAAEETLTNIEESKTLLAHAVVKESGVWEAIERLSSAPTDTIPNKRFLGLVDRAKVVMDCWIARFAVPRD